jgi:hypothetical protein
VVVDTRIHPSVRWGVARGLNRGLRVLEQELNNGHINSESARGLAALAGEAETLEGKDPYRHLGLVL